MQLFWVVTLNEPWQMAAAVENWNETFERDLERDLDAALLGGDSERALADGCCCGELERDLLLDLDLDLVSPLPFSLGDRDLDLDLDRDFSDFSLDLL